MRQDYDPLPFQLSDIIVRLLKNVFGNGLNCFSRGAAEEDGADFAAL